MSSQINTGKIIDGKAFAAALRQRLAVPPRVGPFLVIIGGILWVLYGGVATPSEAAGVGAVFCIVLVIVIYRMTDFTALWGALPYMLCMILGIVLLSLFPQIALWLPTAMMGQQL